MPTIKAEDVRIPRRARDAVARHEEVVVVNRDRPAFVIVHPDDRPGVAGSVGRGRRLREALALLAAGPSPDGGFADDLEGVLADIGDVPGDPWARS